MTKPSLRTLLYSIFLIAALIGVSHYASRTELVPTIGCALLFLVDLSLLIGDVTRRS